MMWQYGWQAHRGSDYVSDPLFACGTDRKWDTQKKIMKFVFLPMCYLQISSKLVDHSESYYYSFCPQMEITPI